jgi:hypothetical protein
MEGGFGGHNAMRGSATSATHLVSALGAAAVCCVLAGDTADAANRPNWATAATLSLELAKPVTLLWTKNPLRQAIGSLSQARHAAILLDRRVDADQKLTISLRGESLGSALRTIADRCGLRVCRLGDVVYLGPPSAAGRLVAVAAGLKEDIRRLPPAIRRKYQAVKPLAWDDLAEPRELLAQLAGENGLEIVGLELVPHDLWAAADLPAASLADRLILVAIQFDLTCKVTEGGSQLRLTPLPAETSPQPETDPAFAARPTPRQPTAAMTPTDPDAIFFQKIVIPGQPLDAVLRKLAEQHGLELKIDRESIRAAGISLDQSVSVQAKNVTLDELLRRLLRSTGLTCHRHQRVVEILPEK